MTDAEASEAADPAPRARRASERRGPEDALDRGISEIFRTDESVRESVATNLKERAVASQAVAEQAKAAFADFSPSRFSPAERDRTTYLAPGDDLVEVMRTTVTDGVDAMRESRTQPTLRLIVTDDLRALLNTGDSNSDNNNGDGGDGDTTSDTLGTIDVGKLYDYIAGKPGTSFAEGNEPAFTACAAQFEAERLLAEIEGEPGDTPPAADRADGDEDTAPGGADGDAAAALAEEQVTQQMSTTTSPEGPLLFNVPQRSDQETRNKAVETFELRDGPSDVTAYHDFTALQIAFAHVWTEIFDGRLRSLGEELYNEYVKLKVFAGADDGDDRSISTLDDLNRLIGDIRELSRTVQDDLPPDLQPAGGAAGAVGAPAGSGDLGAVVRTAFDPASVVTDAIKDDTIRAIVNPVGAAFDALGALFAGKQQLTWASFPGPLPVGNDVITVSVEQNVTEPGTVAIALRNSPEASWWKGIHFREFDATNALVNEFKISNDPRDTDVWSAESYNVLPLYTPQVEKAVLEFGKAAVLGIQTGFLDRLGEKLKDRTRVTFMWTKD